jgi:hypothetical protein
MIAEIDQPSQMREFLGLNLGTLSWQNAKIDEPTRRIAERMLNTPPKQHKEMKLGKRKTVDAKSVPKQHMTRPAGAPTYKKPMVIIGIEARPDGKWRPFEPYCLLPDGTIESASLASSA